MALSFDNGYFVFLRLLPFLFWEHSCKKQKIVLVLALVLELNASMINFSKGSLSSNFLLFDFVIIL